MQRDGFCWWPRPWHALRPAPRRTLLWWRYGAGSLLRAAQHHASELGRLIKPHPIEIMACRREAKQSAPRILKLAKARLTLGTMCTIAPAQFGNFLKRFRADKPGLEIALQMARPAELCELLVKGATDVSPCCGRIKRGRGPPSACIAYRMSQQQPTSAPRNRDRHRQSRAKRLAHNQTLSLIASSLLMIDLGGRDGYLVPYEREKTLRWRRYDDLFDP